MLHTPRGALAALCLASVVLAGPLRAQQAPAPAAPAPGATVPASPVPAAPEPEPPASQLAAARDVVISSGMSRSFKDMVPELREQIAPMLTRTRPDLAKDLDIVIKQLTPEFDKKTDDMIDIAAHDYARHMSEDELKATAAFFNSEAGKKYVSVQPDMLDELVRSMQAWTQTISTYMMTRVRDEMAKKGHQL